MAQNVEEILTREFGNLLRATREQKQLSVADVAARLRLNPHFIEAMEEANIRILPPDPYKKAFLKEYCKALGIDMAAPTEPKKQTTILSTVASIPEVAVDVAKKVSRETSDAVQTTVKTVGESMKDAVEEITSKDLWEEADEVRKERLGLRKPAPEEPANLTIRKKEEPVGASPDTPIAQREEEKPLRRSYTAPAPIEPTKTYTPDEDQFDDYRPGMSNATKVIIGLLVIIASVVGYSIFTKKSNKPTQVITTEQPASQPQAEVPKKDVPQPQAPVDTAKMIASSPGDSLVFVVTANDSVWVSITPDIGNGFTGKLKKGETRTFSAKEKYYLYIGNQKALDMKLNGNTVSGLPTVNNSSIVVRNVVLTRDKAFMAKPDSTASVTPKKAAVPVHPPANHATPSHVNARTPTKQTVKTPTVVKSPEKKPVQPKPTPIKRTIPPATPVLPGAN